MKTLLAISLFLTASCSLLAQDGVGIGITTPDESAILHVDAPSDNKGMLVPRLTILERNNINNPAEGLIIYNETDQAFNYYDGSSWIRLIPTPAKFNLDMANRKVVNLADGTNPGDAVNKSQHDTKVAKAGDTMTGNLNMGNNRVINVGNGVSNGDVVNRSQLNTVQQEVDQAEVLIADLFNNAVKSSSTSNNVSNGSSSTPEVGTILTQAAGQVVMHEKVIQNNSASQKSYFCMAFFHLGGGNSENSVVSASLAKGNNIFAAWNRRVRSSAADAEDLYMISGVFTLNSGESTTLRNRVRIIARDIRYVPRGMIAISLED